MQQQHGFSVIEVVLVLVLATTMVASIAVFWRPTVVAELATSDASQALQQAEQRRLELQLARLQARQRAWLTEQQER